MKRILLTLILCSLGFTQIHAAIIYVSQTATGANDGSSWSNAFTSLQEALNSAQDGDELWVKNGIYFPEEDLTGNPNPLEPREKCFYVGALALNLTIRGGFNGTETTATAANPELNPTIIDGDIGTLGDYLDNNYSLVKINGGNIDFIGFTIQNANGSGFTLPGAIVINSTTETFARFFNCKFLDNRSGYRGASIHATNMNVVHIFDCYFSNNFSSDQGGALYMTNLESLIHNSVFEGCSSGFGGAIKYGYSSAAAPHKVNYCTFINNSTPGIGRGGSIQAFSANVRITNSTFYNSTSQFGEFSIYDCNSFQVYNSIIWSTAIVSPLNVHNGTDVYEVANCIFHTTVNGTNISTDDPKFVNAPENLKLQSCSPGRNAGDNALAATEEPAPFPGVQESIVDLGTHEYVQPEISSNGLTLSLNMAPSVYSADSFQWINCTTGDAIAGATNADFTATASGSYACVTVTSDCSDTSNCVLVDLTAGIDQYEHVVSIYPNPASEIITLNVAQPTAVVLTSANGTVLANIELNNETTIDVSTYAPGIYFIRTAEGQTVKFIKE
jgi:predicted outer membrane repeat protein